MHQVCAVLEFISVRRTLLRLSVGLLALLGWSVAQAVRLDPAELAAG
ncbi:hypothetical protein GHO41_20775 [Pseudomonas sp. FSL R10-0399]|nr:hypothetical protein [Pseudomonas sp. FSL R10-0399]MQT59764.1 hypothetical protein [Pseudomonas sp. FSL R10-0399]